MNQPILYRHASFRFFEKREHHIDRVCQDDVLLLVFEGVLRFSENGEAFEVTAGHYHIQRQGSLQKGPKPSDSPRYLYVHFAGTWSEDGETLNYRGVFDPEAMQPLMEKADRYAHEGYTQTEQTAVFLEILSALYRSQHAHEEKDPMLAFIQQNLDKPLSLDEIAGRFDYSKNQIINIFKKNHRLTPVAYINKLRIQKAMRCLEATSDSAQTIARNCGFQNYEHFYRLFLRQTGQSPSEWRHKRRLTV